MTTAPLPLAGATSPLSVTSIHRYPVKSCRGQSVRSALVEPWGLAGDRRWMLVDTHGVEVTARKHPRLVLVTPSYTSDGLLVERPDADPLLVPIPTGSELVPVTIWKNPVEASLATPEAHAWFSAVVGFSVRLVYLDDPTRRPTSPEYSRSTDRVSFADAFPLLLANESSLAALNDWIPADSPQAPLSMTRFRPSVVVAGPPAWDEDAWRVVRIGSAIFRSVKAAGRCVLTTVNPDTATRGKEPLATLAKHRQWDNKVWFAVNLIPDTPGTVIRVGDDVEVLERVDSLEPQR
ncbi:MAG: MOSC N-terminal beta barrel domain-containing protein [Lacisediminihabitans sp.]